MRRIVVKSPEERSAEAARIVEALENRASWDGRSLGGGQLMTHLDGTPVTFVRICFRIDLESRDWMQAHAARRGQSLNHFVNDLLAHCRRDMAGKAIPYYFEKNVADKAAV
jgi:hypothetical protein